MQLHVLERDGAGNTHPYFADMTGVSTRTFSRAPLDGGKMSKTTLEDFERDEHVLEDDETAEDTIPPASTNEAQTAERLSRQRQKELSNR